MKAVRIESHGGAEELRVVDVPEPLPQADQVVVDVHHVGLNHLDLWVRRGVPGHTFPLPLIPGSDVVGVRQDNQQWVALHPGVGCRACEPCWQGRHDLCRQYIIRGERGDGGCCERVVAYPWELIPCQGSPEEASLPLALLTAWHALMTQAGLRPGQRVLVQAGAGGVSSLAIQVARAAGARVVTTASTPEKRALCVRLGAEHAWPYADLRAGVKGWTDGLGVDVVLEHVGAATWDSSVRALRWGGTLVTFGATTGHKVTLDLRVLFFKQLHLVGSTMGSMAEMAQAWRLVEQGLVKPVVDRVLPMSQIAAAHQLLEDRQVLGKIVLTQDL